MCLPGTVEAVRDRVEREGLPRIDCRTALVGAASAAVAAALPGVERGGRTAAAGADHLQDLTHLFREGFPTQGLTWMRPGTSSRAGG